MTEKILDAYSTTRDSSCKKYQLTVRLPKEIIKQVEKESDNSGVSKAEVVRRYLKSEMRK